MLKKLLLFIAIITLVLPSFAQHGDDQKIDPIKRQAAIKQIVAELNAYQPEDNSDVIQIVQTPKNESIKLSVRLIEKGRIQFYNGSWIYFISSSSHKSSEIGDITLAIDNEGNIYQNEGHVCGGIIHFETHEAKVVNDPTTFFKHFVCDTDDKKWEKY